ncbi:MAG TPA: ABC transporter ATP-binding protein, partial [Ktedonobacter sp.]|nr:ABC transporter ATP-binding protein [Ktedonobacter sp.]
WQLIALTLLAMLSSALSLVYPALTGNVIDSAIQRNLPALQSIIFFLVGLAIIQGIIGFVQNYWTTVVGERLLVDLRTKVYRHVQNLPLSFFLDNKTGELLSRLTNDVTLIRSTLTSNLLGLAQNFITLALGLVIVIAGPDVLLAQANQLNLKLPTTHSTASFGPTLLIVAAILLPIIIIPFLTSGYLRKYVKRELTVLSEATAASEESIGNAKVVKAFTREEYEITRYNSLVWQQFGIILKRARLNSAVQAVTTLLSTAGLAVFLWYGGTSVLNGSLTIGTLTTIVLYITFLTQPFLTIGRLYSQFQISLGAAERIFDLLDEPITLTDEPDALPLPPLQGNLRFEQVSFGYTKDKEVLHEISFEAKQGQVLALVGPSGAGKTTIANLIPRFFDVWHGSITVDGYDIRHVQVKSLREQIGIVLQEPVLFGTTIRENIAYGRLDATQEQIEEAARAANAHEFIEPLPQGYDTLVGERGVKLSGGQRQRIAIARAILRDPRILILDEATANIDTFTELLVQQGLKTLLSGRTALVIAHRLSTIKNSDNIVVLQAGRIAEQGTHSELLQREGEYASLYAMGFRHTA